eukprot:1584336-Pleurochrysis_carterae.AAC.1
MASLLELEEGICLGIFGENADKATEKLLAWLHANYSLLQVGAAATRSISSKHVLAHSFSSGNAEAILVAPYVTAKLERTGNFSFRVVCDSDGDLNMECRDIDDVTDFKPGDESDEAGSSNGRNDTLCDEVAPAAVAPAAAPAL